MKGDENSSNGSDDAKAEVRDHLQDRADQAVEEFDERLIDLLAWILDTETRARIYIHLRVDPESTSEEIADGTGLYPSTVREALAELHDEGIVTRAKRKHDGAGNNPYEYSAISPSELVSEMVGEVQEQLNTVVNLDAHLTESEEATAEPITISVEDAADTESE
ncbi:winged helix-turn-helix transcriptional regulator [Halorhabdus rudnickae]|uniref:winged helix-turn-helix transcriptional regulator n=1 Tax=Halorhabdus rudnickae TaxID=1775544 RepID=UPI0010837A4A|nr:winged helix-turn-helix transcriptional regulator [Halorhabdus rudnickae]